MHYKSTSTECNRSNAFDKIQFNSIASASMSYSHVIIIVIIYQDIYIFI